MYNVKRLICTTIAFLASFALVLPASAEVTREHKEFNDQVIWVECLNDFIILDWVADVVITTVETNRNWMFTQNSRQSGNAVDSYGNAWSFRGHFQATEHADLTAENYTTNFHLLSKDLMIAEPGGPGNLSFLTQWRVRVENGVPTLDLRKTSVECLP
jgi:hypothetical protein